MKFAASINVTHTKRLKLNSAESPVCLAVTDSKQNKCFSIILDKNYTAKFPPVPGSSRRVLHVTRTCNDNLNGKIRTRFLSVGTRGNRLRSFYPGGNSPSYPVFMRVPEMF